MQLTKRIVVDTPAFYALISSTDTFHTQARLSYERLLDWEWEIWTTSYVLLETSSLIHIRLGFEPLETFVGNISRFIQTLWIEESILSEAWRRMVARRGQEFNLIDWTTVVAAEKLGASIFTFKKGFSNEGVKTFPKSREVNIAQ